MGKTNKDSLGERMKGYENISRIYLTKRLPIIIRIDGRSFHSYTKGFKKPFDKILMEAMQETAKTLCAQIPGCKLAYIQSDEISLLLTDYDTTKTRPWFESNLQKLVSVSASIATLAFNRAFETLTKDLTLKDDVITTKWGELSRETLKAYVTANKAGAMFDSRAFVIPKDDVCNYFIWRQQDATRNSIQMVAQSLFSHKELQGKNCADLQDMMMLQKNINWNDLPIAEKRGVCVIRQQQSETSKIKWGVDANIPIFTQDRDYIERFVYLGNDE